MKGIFYLLVLFCLFAIVRAESQDSDEEFIGNVQPKLQNLKKTAPPPIENILQEPQLPPPKTDYYLEMFYGGFILIYILNFFFGKRRNDQIATSWASAVSKAFQSNFSKVGEGKNVGIVKESQHRYILKATGRVHCVGVQATLQLKKRQDLFSVLLELFYGSEDTVTIDVLMDDQAMDTFVFAVLRKKDEKKYRKSVDDLPFFATGNSVSERLPETLCAVSEIEELNASLLTSEVLGSLTKYERFFRRMHFSDQGLVSSTYKKSLQFVFKVPTSESDMEGIEVFTKMAFYYIDLVARTTLSKIGKQKATNHRNKAAEKVNKLTHEQRQEAAQLRKSQKLQKEKEKMASMTPEQQAKYEEKLRQREMKKRVPKMKIGYA